MQSFIMMGKYSSDSFGEMGADRTEKAVRLIKELGGEVKNIFAILGAYDIILITDLPSLDAAMKASLGLSMLTGIAFNTFPAVSVNDFDRIIGEM